MQAASRPETSRSWMRLSEFLPTELVLPAVDAQRKDEVLDALATRLAGYYPEIDLGHLTNVIRERERQVSTALVEGVAIPHARLDGLSRMVAAFARSRAGIDCDSHDGQ